MMNDAKFEKVTQTDTPMYGLQRLLVCGFSAEVQPKFLTVLKMVDMADIPIIWATASQKDETIGTLFGLAGGHGWGASSALPRAIIVSGIMEKQLHLLMDICRKAGMKGALWAAVTPTSETWTLAALLGELSAERAQLANRKPVK
jgi:hypothetical protein